MEDLDGRLAGVSSAGVCGGGGELCVYIAVFRDEDGHVCSLPSVFAVCVIAALGFSGLSLCI